MLVGIVLFSLAKLLSEPDLFSKFVAKLKVWMYSAA